MWYFLYSCGDGSLGEPPRRGDSKCGNMNILLGRKERVSKDLFSFKFWFKKIFFLNNFTLLNNQNPWNLKHYFRNQKIETVERFNLPLNSSLLLCALRHSPPIGWLNFLVELFWKLSCFWKLEIKNFIITLLFKLFVFHSWLKWYIFEYLTLCSWYLLDSFGEVRCRRMGSLRKGWHFFNLFFLNTVIACFPN